MSEAGYNGWPNYPTWATHVWLTNDQGTYEQVSDLAAQVAKHGRAFVGDSIREYVSDLMAYAVTDEAGLHSDLLSYAIEQVDWLEVADAFLADVEAEVGRIETRGYNDGRVAGSWAVDGTTSNETCAALLRGMEEGDPVILDALPLPQVGGEWAGDPNWAEILREEECADADDARGDLFEVYCDAFARGVEEQVTSDCRARCS